MYWVLKSPQLDETNSESNKRNIFSGIMIYTFYSKFLDSYRRHVYIRPESSGRELC